MHRTTLLGANLSKLGSGDWLPPGATSAILLFAGEPAGKTPANNGSADDGPVGSAPPLMRQRL